MSAKMYNAIVNVGDTSQGSKGYIKYRKISSMERFKVFLDSKYPQWRFATIYDYSTREKIKVISR